MKPVKTFFIAILVIFLALSVSSIYTIQQGQLGLVSRLGQIQTDKKTDQPILEQPGLHFKIPFITKVLRFDMRLQTLDIQASRIVTKEKKDVIVDYYVKWRIVAPALYYTRTGGDELNAENLLTQQLNDTLRAEFGKRTIREVVSDERSAIMNKLKAQADIGAQRLGVEVSDVRIKRIDLPSEVSSAVYERMRAERERVATEHRAEGKAQGEMIRAQADANVSIMLSTARTQASKIRAEGEAKAAQMYAQAYNKDAAFYAFYRSLLAYQKSFANKNDILVLKPDTQFFAYFNNTQGVPFSLNSTTTNLNHSIAVTTNSEKK